MFDFGNTNKAQQTAISTVNGPVLIIAGPGTGKTFTLVQRAIYLIQECNVRPEQIFMATFTDKAAKELVTRITNELSARNINVNINEMYIGTFHSLCLRIIKEYLEFTRLKRNFKTIDSFEQLYIVLQHIFSFKSIDNIETLFTNESIQMIKDICFYVNNLQEELIDIKKLKKDDNVCIRVLGDVFEKYLQILSEDNLVDFSSIQTEAYRLISENENVLQELKSRFKYIMIDEYQDTNYIQEQLVFLLVGEDKNVCVVGDDDQGLYRFRGATIRNILEFPNKFKDVECKVIRLVENYRSNSDIVNFYNTWMNTTSGKKFSFSWDNFRYNKTIEPFRSNVKSPAVIKISSEADESEWHEKLLNFVLELKSQNKISNFNQIAFLFKSVKNIKIKNLASYFEDNGINVYSPRSDMFFERSEVRLVIGIFLFLFPAYVCALENEEFSFLNNDITSYYKSCIKFAEKELLRLDRKDLLFWLQKHGKIHIGLKGTTDYAYSGLLYQMFEFEPFKSILCTDLNKGVVDVRPARNLALLSKIIVKFEYLHKITVLNGKNINTRTERFFNQYFKFLIDGGINEYEDDSEYAPSGCVSFLTIHQSKGMEFPIVVVGSLGNVPKNKSNEILLEIEDKYFSRTPFEPLEQIKFYDFWRLFYTAFSRAQDLLVLSCNETSRCPSKYFKDIYDNVISYDSSLFNIADFEFQSVKPVNIKETFSFTSQITVYETCSLQYKFYKDLGFIPVRSGAMIFGRIVHETIEDIHRAAIRKEEFLITPDNITKWFNANYSNISKIEHSYLAEPQQEAALKQVLRYAEKQNGNWDSIKQTEVDVSIVKPTYILEGKIDLIKGTDNTVEIVDFKSEKKPDLIKYSDRLEQYRRQLHIYAHLVEEKTHQKVSKMHLYYTGEENGVPTITFPYTKSAIEGTIASFDDTVARIMQKKYSKCATDSKVCRNCDFRYYCEQE